MEYDWVKIGEEGLIPSMRPLEALHACISRALTRSGTLYHKKDKPGSIVMRMGEATREALQYLRSEDISLEKVPRYHLFGDEEYENKLRLSEMKMEFDKKLRG